jgi:hypothetical protein
VILLIRRGIDVARVSTPHSQQNGTIGLPAGKLIRARTERARRKHVRRQIRESHFLSKQVSTNKRINTSGFAFALLIVRTDKHLFSMKKNFFFAAPRGETLPAKPTFLFSAFCFFPFFFFFLKNKIFSIARSKSHTDRFWCPVGGLTRRRLGHQERNRARPSARRSHRSRPYRRRSLRPRSSLGSCAHRCRRCPRAASRCRCR